MIGGRRSIPPTPAVRAADSFSIGEAVMEVTTTVDDLNQKLGIYSDQLFRQARWEAELRAFPANHASSRCQVKTEGCSHFLRSSSPSGRGGPVCTCAGGAVENQVS